jgi:hypothetical protein
MSTVTLQSLRVSPEVLAKILACGNIPATDVLSQYAGAPLSIQFSERYDRDLTRREARLLRSPGPGHVRQGFLVTPDSQAVAEVSAVLLASRIPAEARSQLGIPLPCRPMPEPSALPLGPVLARFGISRWPLGAEAEDGVVRSSAMLMRGKSGVGLVTEMIPCG